MQACQSGRADIIVVVFSLAKRCTGWDLNEKGCSCADTNRQDIKAIVKKVESVFKKFVLGLMLG